MDGVKNESIEPNAYVHVEKAWLERVKKEGWFNGQGQINEHVVMRDRFSVRTSVHLINVLIRRWQRRAKSKGDTVSSGFIKAEWKLTV
jgi:hypothetical protein